MRKFIQVTAVPYGSSGQCYGVCDDGSVWVLRDTLTGGVMVPQWFRLPDAPQDPPATP